MEKDDDESLDAGQIRRENKKQGIKYLLQKGMGTPQRNSSSATEIFQQAMERNERYSMTDIIYYF